MKALLLILLFCGSGALAQKKDSVEVRLTDFQRNVLAELSSQKKKLEEEYSKINVTEDLTVQLIADFWKVDAQELKNLIQSNKPLKLIVK